MGGGGRKRRTSCKDGGRDWNDVATSQGTPRIAESTRNRKQQERNSSLESSEGEWPCQRLDFSLLASRAVREYISVVFNHPVCSNLLQQPWEANTADNDNHFVENEKTRAKEVK